MNRRIPICTRPSLPLTSLPLALVALLAGACGGGDSPPTTPETGQALARLEHRVTLLEDSKAIRRLQRAYGYYLDKGMGDRIGDLFSNRPDASVELAGSGVYVGQDRIREVYAAEAGPLAEGELANHMILQGVVHVAEDGASARGRWRGLIQTGIHLESADWAEGPYENQYVKEDGVWQFHKVRWYATVLAPYDPGWHRGPQPLPGPVEGNPPDREPTDVYQSFPSAHLAPYHYPNPVTGPRAEPSQPQREAGADLAPAIPDLRDAWERLRRVEARAARVRDVNQIENLQKTYGYYLDKMLWDQVADLFAGDGTMEIGPSGVYEGTASIRAYLYSLSGGVQGPVEGELYEHMQLQPIITVAPDGQTARGRWRAFMQLGTHGQGTGGTWGEGVYENLYRKEDGVWKISSLRFYPNFLAPYEGGWMNASRERVDSYAMGRGVEPDRPPSGPYASYPEYFVPPFHYGAEVASIAEPLVSGSGVEGDLAALDARIANEGAAVGLLEDADAIENLSGIYGFYVDMNMQDDIADLFNEEGVVEILGRGVFVGIDRVRQYMHNLSAVGPQENRLFNHMHLQPVIHVAPDGRSARARSRLFVMFGIFPAAAQWGAGIYENEFVKEDGVWKIDYLHGYQTFYTAYEAGWARTPNPMMGLYPQLPPDRGQSVAYDPYPAAFVPPFHYPNPVTGRTE